ncbi:universal stress protein [Qaidamihabitans albus]|uniref:universal stress protein n=1 Tax=Qaidamihabitans albus TaxID=2795733 RepID=UPI0018F26F1D|nr:universal stress protein [Qaidamihabitans albus]
MTNANQGNAPIVVGVDSSEASLRAVRWAANTAAKHHAPLHLVHAAGFPDLYVGSNVPPPEAFKEELREKAWESLHQAKRVAEQIGDIQVEARFETDPPVPYLIHASRTARMIVLGSSGHTGFAGMMLGSVTLSLVSHARCPVVSIRDDYDEIAISDDRPVVVGVDGSPLSERALGYAFDEASFRGVELVAVHTWSDADSEFAFSQARLYYDWEPLRDTEERRLAERLAGWPEKYPDVHVRRVVVRDRPRHELLEWSKKAQLVVIGSRGRGGFRGMLLGSTSQALTHNAHCPVMIARPEPDED